MERNKKLTFHLLTSVEDVMVMDQSQDLNLFPVLHAEVKVK